MTGNTDSDCLIYVPMWKWPLESVVLEDQERPKSRWSSSTWVETSGRQVMSKVEKCLPLVLDVT